MLSECEYFYLLARASVYNQHGSSRSRSNRHRLEGQYADGGIQFVCAAIAVELNTFKIEDTRFKRKQNQDDFLKQNQFTAISDSLTIILVVLCSQDFEKPRNQLIDILVLQVATPVFNRQELRDRILLTSRSMRHLRLNMKNYYRNRKQITGHSYIKSEGSTTRQVNGTFRPGHQAAVS